VYKKKLKTSPTISAALASRKHSPVSLEREAAVIHRGFDILNARLDEEEQSLLITAQALILCGLPYKPVEGHKYQRQARTAQGIVRLTVTALDSPETPLPFGKDRVTLAWLTTKAMQTGQPVVEWKSASEFFDLFHLDKGGKGYRLFWESWKRLAKAAFVIETITKGHDAGRVAPILEQWDLPTLHALRDEEKGLVLLPGMRYGVELGHSLWAHLKAHPVPLPLEVMREFQDEPKAWDFAAYLSWRSYLCQHSDSVARIAWRDLIQQLGSEDTNHKRLRKSLKAILRRLHLVWPELRAGFMPSGVLEIRPPLRGMFPESGR
jgi:hypothetical protein